MSFNVKPGDTARVVIPGPFLGVIVIVGERYPHDVGGEPSWTFTPRLFLPDGDEQVSFFDRVLRPIRWDDREDPRDLRVSKPADTAPALPDYLTGQGA